MIWLLLFFLSSTQALPSGTPHSVCNTMLLFHEGGIPRQTDPSPFGVSVMRNGYGYMITVKSLINAPFQGFVLQARDPSSQLVGTFEPTADLFHTIYCQGIGNTLTHFNTQQKLSVVVQWNPDGYEGPITFNATVAQDYGTFWAGIESQQVQITKGLSNQSSADFDPFYEGCNVKKSCFGSPAGCVESKNCKVVTAITVFGDRYEFELKAIELAYWAGVGLSDDSLMGDDSVIECVKEAGTVKAYLSYTSPRPMLNVVRSTNQYGIQLLESSIKNGSLYCRVLRETKMIVNDREYDLAKDKYYLVIAAGSSVSANKVLFHDITYLPSEEKKLLSDVSAVKAAFNYL